MFSPDALTLALAFDPRLVSLVELNARLDRKLAKHKSIVAAVADHGTAGRPADGEAVG